MKKKKVEPKEEKLDGDDIDGFDDSEIEIAVPKIEKKPEKTQENEVLGDLNMDEVAAQEDLEFEFEEEPEGVSYKYLRLSLTRGSGENDYTLDIENQSHGLLNALVRQLLEIKGVNIAAYKVTKIEQPKIYIRLENNKYRIKDILFKGIELLREEVGEVHKLFQKII